MRLWYIAGGAALIAIIVLTMVVLRTPPEANQMPGDQPLFSCAGKSCFFDGLKTCTPSWTAWSYLAPSGDDQFIYLHNISVTPGKGGCLVTATNRNFHLAKKGPDGIVTWNVSAMIILPEGQCTISPERLYAIFTAAEKQGYFSSDANLFCPIFEGRFLKS